MMQLDTNVYGSRLTVQRVSKSDHYAFEGLDRLAYLYLQLRPLYAPENALPLNHNAGTSENRGTAC